GVDDLTVANDGEFTFSTPVESGRTYNVAVASQPSSPAQECTVESTSAAGTVAAANVTNVRVQGVTVEFTLAGTVSGLLGSGLVLQNNAQDDLAIAADSPYTFKTSLRTGTPYSVTVATQPSNPTQACTVARSTGTMGTQNIGNID